ncbi:ImmA/IrrE family metallo-endopeptidase [Clostridium saccharoperbutylacetonicum]
MIKIERAKKIANTLIKFKKLTPPIDIFELIKQYSSVEINKDIPFTYDGLCFFNNGKPSIILNGEIPYSRQQFTLAHELGHILIPGHKNIVACHVEANDTNYGRNYDETNFVYMMKEREANAFASELLLPSNWIEQIVNRLHSFQEIIENVGGLTELSIQAITIRVIEYMKPGNIIFIDYMNSGKPIMFVSSSTNLYRFDIDCDKLRTSKLERKKLEVKSKSIERFTYNKYSIVVYDIYEDLEVKPEILASEKSSTEILRDYLETQYTKQEATKIFQSINGIIGNMNSLKSVKTMSEEEYYANINKKFRNKNEEIRKVASTIYFRQYIVKRYNELMSK